MKTKIFFACFLLSTLFASGQRPQADPQVMDLRNEKDSLLLARKLIKLENSGIETDAMLLVRYYNAVNKTGKAQEIFDKTAERFPQGEYAGINAYNKVITEKDPVKKELLLRQYQSRFPVGDASMLYFDVAQTYAEQKNGRVNTGKIKEYLGKITDKSAEGMYKSIVIEQLNKNGEPELAEKMIKELLATTKPLIATYVQTPPVPGQRPPSNPKNDYYRYLALYANILYTQHKYPEALVYAREVYDSVNKKNAVFIQSYMNILMANGKLAEAFPLMDKAYREGMANAEIKKNLKQAFSSFKGSLDGYDAYYDSLQCLLTAKTKENVNKFRVDGPAAPLFTLKDLTGKTVSLASLKGKVVVLDFWATWCGPCKKSFPAMQMAVNKYKNNPDVVFLFIDTWEHVDNPLPGVKQYIKDEKFNFQVLMDLKDPVTKTNNVIESYKVTGIPTKFIIDKKGNISFRLTGFSGGDDGAVEELSAMIEMAGR